MRSKSSVHWPIGALLAYIDALSESHPLIMTNLNYVFFSTCENFFDLGYLILDRP